MLDPRHVASQILGAIDWQTEVSGFCRCPGEALHTSDNGKRDCRVNVDGAPTIFCFHASCATAVAEANRCLRREMNSAPWELRLPDGRSLQSGDVLQASGMILPREAVKARARAEGREAGEQLVLMTLRRLASQFRPELFEFFRWPVAEIFEDSPLKVGDRDPEDQFRTWLKLWPACSTVWIGDIYSSGKPEHRTHFRPVAEWYQIGPAMGNYTCGSSFKPGSFSRCNENLNGHRFMVVESDTLSKDEVGAVFAYLIAWRARYSDGFNRHGLGTGEAMLGDWCNYGMTEQEYRTGKRQLAKWKFATFRLTPKGTVARLVDSRLFEVTPSTANTLSNTQLTPEQHPANTQLTPTVRKKEGIEGRRIVQTARLPKCRFTTGQIDPTTI